MDPVAHLPFITVEGTVQMSRLHSLNSCMTCPEATNLLSSIVGRTLQATCAGQQSIAEVAEAKC